MSSCVVIDTNVLLVANGGHPDVSDACRLRCIDALQAAAATHTPVIDDAFLILGEYLHKLQPGRGKGVGDVFLKWLLQHAASARVERVAIHTRGPDHYVEFPDAELQEVFDPADRKFVAVAHAHPQHPPIWQAADSKWLDWWPALAGAGVTVVFLCPDDACRFHDHKFPDRPCPALPPHE